MESVAGAAQGRARSVGAGGGQCIAAEYPRPRQPCRGRHSMCDIDACLSALHSFARRAGASVDYADLPNCIGGCLDRGRIVLRADLAPEQELLTLVHELTHVMAHGGAARSRTRRTLCE